mgnify:CR=1 FL=1
MKKIPIILILIALILIFPWIVISWKTSGILYRDIEVIPARKVGLLLWTTPSVEGRINLFYTTRIEATKLLYEKGKIQKIIVSGDNSNASYNEPEYMRNSLVKAGIPESAITLDYAGFRTLDSVVRAKEVFSQTGGFIIISQPFHVERALFLAEKNNIDAIGYGAANVSFGIAPSVYFREIGARWLALFDAYFWTEPWVLGKTEKLNGE